MSSESRILAGAMSGTSADGVDVALVEIQGSGLQMTAHLLHHHARSYEPALRDVIFRVRQSPMATLAELAQLARDISLSYAAAVNESIREMGKSPIAIAAHGQTLFHNPPNTIQWFDPALVASLTGCAVVSDFRRADLAVGGQGAPLVPFADYLLFRHPTRNRVLLNIGGIANFTWLAAGAEIGRITAMDTGPGNCICDWICRKAGRDWDEGGLEAMRGNIRMEVVEAVLREPFFARPGPKSTDGPAMIAAFEKAALNIQDQNDLLATAAYITAASIAAALPDASNVEIIASGGGTNNVAIMMHLRNLVSKDVAFSTPETQGIPSAAKEAMAFALLGAATLNGEPSNVPSVTGARCRVVLGSITPQPQGV